MVESGSIEAVLRLNTSQFDGDIHIAKRTVSSFIESMNQVVSSFGKLENQKTSIRLFNTFSLGVSRSAKALDLFIKASNNSDISIQKLNEFLDEASTHMVNFYKEIQKVATGESEVSGVFQHLSSIVSELNPTLQNLKQNINNTSDELNPLSSSMKKVSTSSDELEKEFSQSKSSLNDFKKGLDDVNKKLDVTNTEMKKTSANTKKMSNSLGFIGTALRSKFSSIFNSITSRMEQSIIETYKAKSEMNSWLDMLGLTTSQVTSFNSALDKTVAKFQRVNKYGMGETIASLGVEFKLSEKEMEKAMNVTAMVTNEYLRAGRSSSEANLAIKDILQGQFQRLSRETGVGELDLIDTKLWDGDPTDTMGIIKALDKIAKSRNWDTIAQKATSINDIFTIGENKISVWTADLIDRFTPSITSLFNSVMTGFDMIAPYVESLLDWMGGDGLSQTAAKIGTITTALMVGSNALISYRTGATLLQIAQMGLKDSLIATVLGLEAETTATYGSRNAIIAKIAGISAERAGELSLKQAIATRILGLNAETVAEKGVASAIKDTIVKKQLESAEEKINTASKEVNTAETVKNTTANKFTQESIYATMLGKKAETVEEEANTAAKELNTLASGEQTIANEGLLASLYMLGTGEAIVTGETGALSTAWGVLNGVFMLSPIGWITAGILALAGAVYVLTGGLDESWSQMKHVNEMLDNTDETMQQQYDYLHSIKEKLGETSTEYENAAKAVHDFNTELNNSQYAKDNLESAIGGKTITAQNQSEKLLKQHGVGDSQLKAFSQELQDMELFQDKYYKALQVYNKQFADSDSDYVTHTSSVLDVMQKRSASNEELSETTKKLTTDYERLAEHSAIANTSDDWFDWAFNSAYAGMDQFWIDWDTFWAAPTWTSAINGTLGKILDVLGFDDLFKELGFGDVDVGKTIMDFLGDAPTAISDWWDDTKSKLNDCWNNIKSYDFIGEFLKTWGLENVDVSKVISDFFNGIGDAIFKTDWSFGLSDWWNGVVDGFKKDITDGVNGFLTFDWLPDFDFIGGLMDVILPSGVAAADGSDHPSFMEDLSDIFGFDIQQWIDNFKSDPLGTLGISDVLNINDLVSAIFSLGDGDISPLIDWFNQSIISPICNIFYQFAQDPTAFIGEAGFTIAQFLDAFLPVDVVGIWSWVYENITEPISSGLQNYLSQIPIVNQFVSLLGLLSDENIGAEEKGRAIGNWIGKGVTAAIGEIPIVGDILKALGLIPQTNSDANTKGKGVGDNIKQGVQTGQNGTSLKVSAEMNDVVSAISGVAKDAYGAAKGVGESIWNGINSILQRHSPGFIHDQVKAEFGTDIPEAIQSSGELAYSIAQSYGQQVVDGVSSATNTNLGLDSMVGSYETDAQSIAYSSQLMGSQTTMAFNQMQSQVNATTTQMEGNVTSSYTLMQQKQNTLLQNMKQSNITAYNEMYSKSNNSLLEMRDSTSNVTHQMTNAWNTMKNNIVSSANKLKSESTTHFNSLSTTIGSFYRKIQNPSNWGAGSLNYTARARRPVKGKRAVSSIHGKRGAGYNPYKSSDKVMTLRELRSQIGQSNIFDGLDMTQKVNVSDFLSMFDGGFGWSGWDTTHFNYIKNTSDKWKMSAPKIMDRIQAGNGYTVGEFENGQPKISWSAFLSTAEAIFSEIPYKFYYNSEWKGSWVEALKAGATNCNDGTEALIALAETMGFSGTKVHTNLKSGVGHFYAVINGKTMDTTNFQNHGSWSKLGAGTPVRRGAGNNHTTTNNKSINVIVDMSGSTVYGIDDLDAHIERTTKKVMREEFNDPYTIPL